MLILPKLIVGIGILIVTFFISAWLKKFVRVRLQKRIDDLLLATFIGKIVRWILIIIGFIIFMQVMELSALAGGLLAGASISAFIIGFAFKDIGENFLAGIILAFDRPFKIGDIIVTEDIMGTVKQLNLRTTNITTMDGHDVFVPNAIILKSPLTNYNTTALRRHEFTVGIDYAEDGGKAIAVVNKILDETPEVLREPAPQVFVNELAASSVVIRALFWFNNEILERPWLVVKGDVIRRTKEAFDKEGISIPFDIREIRMYEKNPPLPLKLENGLSQDAEGEEPEEVSKDK